MHVSMIELWSTMGPVARGIVALLVLMSAVSLATGAERWLTLRRAARASAAFLARWRAQLSADGVRAASSAAIEGGPSPAAALVAAGSEVLLADLSPDVRREAYDRVVRRIVLATGADLRRGLALLATIGSTAPFVGLVGTVLGIVNAFGQLAVSGGGVGQVSAGIAEALVTTAVGIGVAIPAVWLYNALTQRARTVMVEMQCVAEELAVAALGEAGLPRADTIVRGSR